MGAFVFCTKQESKSTIPKKVTVIRAGDVLDEFNGVKVYRNGNLNIKRRHVVDGYNLGLRYQCVEFVKRYYYEYLNHKMPNTYGNASDFFHTGLKNSALNSDRNLIQYINGAGVFPEVNDLVVFGGGYGHVAIVSKVDDNSVEIIQQNTGSSRASYKLEPNGRIKSGSILGWLRRE